MEIMPNKMVKAGQVVFNEGDMPLEGLYFICYGEVEISRADPLSGKRILATMKEGDVFGEMGVINSAPRNATVKALSDCGFYTSNIDQFQHQVNQLDTFIRGAFKVMVLAIRDYQAQQEELSAMLADISTRTQQAKEVASHQAGSLKDGVAQKMLY